MLSNVNDSYWWSISFESCSLNKYHAAIRHLEMCNIYSAVCQELRL